MIRNFLFAGSALFLSATSLAQQTPTTAPPSTAASSIPQAPLKLWMVPLINASGGSTWLEENTVKRNGAVVDFWMLTIGPDDKETSDSGSTSGAWFHVQTDCTNGKTRRLGGALIAPLGKVVFESSKQDAEATKSRAGSPIELLVNQVCSGSLANDGKPRASTALMAIQ